LLLAMHVNGDHAATFTGKEIRQSTFSGLEPAGAFVDDTGPMRSSSPVASASRRAGDPSEGGRRSVPSAADG
jgi:hypothetical protein